METCTMWNKMIEIMKQDIKPAPWLLQRLRRRKNWENPYKLSKPLFPLI